MVKLPSNSMHDTVTEIPQLCSCLYFSVCLRPRGWGWCWPGCLKSFINPQILEPKPKSEYVCWLRSSEHLMKVLLRDVRPFKTKTFSLGMNFWWRSFSRLFFLFTGVKQEYKLYKQKTAPTGFSELILWCLCSCLFSKQPLNCSSSFEININACLWHLQIMEEMVMFILGFLLCTWNL